MLSFAEGSRRSSLTEEQKRRTSPAWLVERREAKFNMYVAGFVNAYRLGSRSSLTEEQKGEPRLHGWLYVQARSAVRQNVLHHWLFYKRILLGFPARSENK